MRRLPLSFLAFTGIFSIVAACGSAPGGRGGGSGGHDAGSGGSGSGGAATSGAATGGTTATGGVTGSGGVRGTGGAASGGIVGSGGVVGGTGGAVATGGVSAAGTGGGTGSGGLGSGGTPGTGGATGVAGSTGSGGTGGAGGHAAGCAGASYKLCEDFENAGPSGSMPSGWTALPGYGGGANQGVAVSTATAHSGVVSLQSDSSMTGQARVQKSLTGLGATASKHWGRIFYKVQTPPVMPMSGVLHITFVGLQGTTEDRVVDLVENSDGKHQWLFNVPDDSCCTGSTYDWSFDTTWHCAEWYVDASAQTYRFFTDKTEVTSIGFTKNAGAKMSNWTAIGLGAIFYQSPPSPVIIWFDDLAIDDYQIGCD